MEMQECKPTRLGDPKADDFDTPPPATMRLVCAVASRALIRSTSNLLLKPRASMIASVQPLRLPARSHLPESAVAERKAISFPVGT
jgi:hypothetical protein